MLSCRDQHAFPHQARGITDPGYILSARFDRKAFQVGPPENDACVGRSGREAQVDAGASVQSKATESSWRSQSVLVCQSLPLLGLYSNHPSRWLRINLRVINTITWILKAYLEGSKEVWRFCHS